jgi:hypothetical protein
MSQLISASEIRRRTGLNPGVLVTARKNPNAPQCHQIGREFYYEASALEFFEKANALREGDMTEKNAAEHLGVGLIVLKRLRKTGEGPYSRRVGNCIIYNEKDLNAWVKARFGQGSATKEAPEPASV